MIYSRKRQHKVRTDLIKNSTYDPQDT